MKKTILSCIILSLFSQIETPAFGQPFKLLKDINESPWWSSTVGPRNMYADNQLLYFYQDTGMWRTDGTNAGTIFLKRITPDKMVSVNGLLFVSGNVFGFGPGLWRSDGSAAGTVEVDYINMGNAVSDGNMLFFSKDDGVTGEELWKSDGTEAGTTIVADITPGPGGSSISHLFMANGTLYFNVGTSLWKSDGTAAGTLHVKDGAILAYPYALPDGRVYFVNNENELWKCDGTDPGTAMIATISIADLLHDNPLFTYVNGSVFFIGDLGSADAALWKTDGTAAGTGLVKNILPGYDGVRDLLSYNNSLYFLSNDGVDGSALWRSDGTETGTVQIKNSSLAMAFLNNVNGTLFFSNFDETSGHELWKSDGSAAGTIIVKDIYEGSGNSFPLFTDTRATEPPGGQGFAILNNTLYFSAANGINGRELWKTNGTPGGTTMVKDIYRPNMSANPRFFTKVNGTVYFTAYDRFSSPFLYHHDELYKTDGTLSGTSMVRDLFGLGSGLPTNLTFFKDEVYFSATDGLGFELFKSNGTYNGTVKVKDINATNGQNSNPASLSPAGDQLFFSANDGTNGNELWKTDGTETGTLLVKNINATGADSDPASLIYFNNTLFFSADDGTNGRELWKSDGTEAGTVIVKNINAAGNSNPDDLTQAGNTFFFIANDGVNGRELWKSDGTEAGTLIVKNINAGGDSNPGWLTNINGTVYFTADDGIHGVELWKTDGTEAGTILVHDIYTGPGGSQPSELTVINNQLFFAATDAGNGRELWSTDGTEINTLLVKDIFTGVSSSNPAVLTGIGNNLIFAANDGITGNELWVSNGTGPGTRIMQDIEPGIDGSDPTEIIELNGKLLASVFTSYFGREIWVSNVPAEIPLPLELLEFKGAVVNNQGELQWKTEHEFNTSVFIVERSVDGRNYSAFGSVPAANTSGVHYYRFTDPDILALGASTIYYRLKQTDLDGQYAYSNIVKLVIGSHRPFVMLYPNPVKNRINITITSDRPEKLQWQLFDQSGRLTREGNYVLANGSTALSIHVAELDAGIYILHLRGNNIQEAIKVLKH